MTETADLKALAKRVFQRDTQRDSERDGLSRQGETASETARQSSRLNPAVPSVSGVSPVSGVSGGPFGKVLGALESRCPDCVDAPRWQRAIEDARTFLATWGEQAHALGWSNRDLFGLHTPPANPHPSYSRLSRYDATGLVWLLQGRPVIALTGATAAIQSLTGAITNYRKHNKPALGPVGDSLDDLA